MYDVRSGMSGSAASALSAGILAKLWKRLKRGKSFHDGAAYQWKRNIVGIVYCIPRICVTEAVDSQEKRG